MNNWHIFGLLTCLFGIYTAPFGLISMIAFAGGAFMVVVGAFKSWGEKKD